MKLLSKQKHSLLKQPCRNTIQRGTGSVGFLHGYLSSECFCFERSFISFFFFSCENCSYFFVSLKDLHPYLQYRISRFRRNRCTPENLLLFNSNVNITMKFFNVKFIFFYFLDFTNRNMINTSTISTDYFQRIRTILFNILNLFFWKAS